MSMLEQNNFSESRAHEAFRRVVNRLQKHYPAEIITSCIKILNENPQDKLEHIRLYPPWRLLLLIKWTFLYGDYTSPKRKRLTKVYFNYLLNVMNNLYDNIRFPGEYKNIFLFFRNMAFEQFWLQHDFNISNLARQNLLFGRLRNEHPFKRNFLKKFGISITDFIELSMIMMPRFVVEKQVVISSDWFRNIADKFNPGTIEKFLELLSIDFETLKEKLIRERQTKRKVSYEVYEKTPLIETPMIKSNSNYYPFYRELLARSIESFIYDTLRDEDANAFMNKFGPIFERYIEKSISSTKIKYYTEKELNQLLPSEGKVVDFVMIDGNRRIFIDAKGVEMAYLGMVGHEPETITQQTRRSIVKGVQQSLETAKRFKEFEKTSGIDCAERNNYLIIVTFKEMYVGNGTDFNENVAKETFSKMMKHDGTEGLIPFEHMYFMCVDDFDFFMGGVSSGEIDLAKMLDYAINCDKFGNSKKFTFGQHLFEKYPNTAVPEWLINEIEYIKDCCKLRFN